MTPTAGPRPSHRETPAHERIEAPLVSDADFVDPDGDEDCRAGLQEFDGPDDEDE
jgi:hypothetical protein